ncbi:MAG: AraC family transcriptional regulator [Bacteroidales bacterium]|nr:AraC family transcriptional regulator [Bacteroidales bacterium]
MTNKDVILKSIRFIENNLKEEIDVFKVSREVCYSLYHFIRLFQSITGFSPGNYIQQRRLSQAVDELRNTGKKVADIAYDFQFGSPESFTRAFRKQFHVNPTEIRSGISLSSLALVSPITPDFIYQSGKVRNTPPELVVLPEKTLVGISFFISDSAGVNDLSKEWTRLINEVNTIKNRTVPERYYQVQFWSDTQELGGMYFFTGVEVTKPADVDSLFVIKNLPRGKYLRFIHKGFSNKVGYTYKYIYNQFLPDTEYKLTKPFNFEFYGEKYKGPFNEQSESEIYIPVE